jgi:hypothetical protein
MEGHEEEFKRLSVEDVRKFPGFEGRTEEEIKAIILEIEKLSVLIYKRLNNYNQHEPKQIPP